MKTDTTAMREKYAKITDSIGRVRYPVGGRDIHSLCSAVDQLVHLVRECQHKLPVADQNEIEKILWGI